MYVKFKIQILKKKLKMNFLYFIEILDFKQTYYIINFGLNGG